MLYCLCQAQPDTEGAGKPDAQVLGAPNRYCGIRADLMLQGDAVHDAEGFPPVALRQPMRVVAMGVSQVILHEHTPNTWDGGPRPTAYRPHYPSVDIYECPTCGSRVVRE